MNTHHSGTILKNLPQEYTGSDVFWKVIIFICLLSRFCILLLVPSSIFHRESLRLKLLHNLIHSFLGITCINGSINRSFAKMKIIVEQPDHLLGLHLRKVTAFSENNP